MLNLGNYLQIKLKNYLNQIQHHQINIYYGLWIIRRYLAKDTIKNLDYYLGHYDKFRNKNIITKNIDSIKSFDELGDLVVKQITKPKRTKTDIKAGVKSNKDVYSKDIVFENDNVLIVLPKTIQDAQKYGKKGNWCISSKCVADGWFNPDTENTYIIYPKINLNKLIPKKEREFYYMGETEPEDDLDIPVARDLSIIANVVNKTGTYIQAWDKRNERIPSVLFNKVIKLLDVPQKIFK